jgi:hypothetical protein
MPYIRSLDLFHVHNPRCGGTSINAALSIANLLEVSSIYDLSPRPELFYGNIESHKSDLETQPKLELDHLSLSMIVSRLDLTTIKRTIFFASVRHPWDRFVSEYRRKKSTGDSRLIDASDCEFSDYMRKFANILLNKRGALKSQFNASHFWPQHYFADFSQFIDIHKYYVLRTECLEMDWYRFQKSVGFVAPLPSRKNTTGNMTDDEKLLSEDKFMKEHPEEYGAYRKYYEYDYHAFNYQ